MFTYRVNQEGGQFAKPDHPLFFTSPSPVKGKQYPRDRLPRAHGFSQSPPGDAAHAEPSGAALDIVPGWDGERERRGRFRGPGPQAWDHGPRGATVFGSVNLMPRAKTIIASLVGPDM